VKPTKRSVKRFSINNTEWKHRNNRRQWPAPWWQATMSTAASNHE